MISYRLKLLAETIGKTTTVSHKTAMNSLSTLVEMGMNEDAIVLVCERNPRLLDFPCFDPFLYLLRQAKDNRNGLWKHSDWTPINEVPNAHKERSNYLVIDCNYCGNAVKNNTCTKCGRINW